MAPGLYCATKRTQNLKGFPGLRLPPPGCSLPRTAAAQGGVRGPEPLHLRHAPHPPRPPPTPAVPAPRCSDPTARPGAPLPTGPAPAGPPALPSPEGASERRPGEPDAGRSAIPGRLPDYVGQGAPGTPRPAVLAPCKQAPRGGAARPGGGGTEKAVAPGKLPRRSLSCGGCAALISAPAPRTDPAQPLPAQIPPAGGPLPGVLPPGRPRARAAALTLHSGARGSCSLLPPLAPAVAPAPPGRPRAARGRGGGWRRSGPRAGASWRGPPLAGPFRSARPCSPSLPACLPSTLPPFLPPLAPPPPPLLSRRSVRCARRPGAGGGAGRMPPRAPPPRPSARPVPAPRRRGRLPRPWVGAPDQPRGGAPSPPASGLEAEAP